MCRLKAAQTRNKELESGEHYIKLKKLHQKECRAYERKIQALLTEIEDAHKENIRVRNYWFQVLEDILLEFEAMQKKAGQKLREMEKRALLAERQRDDVLEKAKEFRLKFYETATQLEEEQGKNLKLHAQINRDYENSSIPSSKTIRQKKIANSREKTGRKPGGQPGHKGHGRKKQEPTQPVILLTPPGKVLDDHAFKKTARTIIKQMVSIRAFLFLLNNDCCTSIDKSRKFLSALTDGKLNISKGMISKLSREFALKTEPERREAYADMLLSPVMHTDCTNGRENGKSCQIYVCATPDGKALYFAREKKGHEGVKGTVTEDYQGILVHDHDITFYNYGADHQECLAHMLRYLKDSMDNEPNRAWNKDMIPGYLPTNNEAERLLRNYKRKQAQAVTFRSFESIDYLCQCMSMLVLMRLEEPANIFDRVSRIFG